jgi:hypothetical protein
MLPTLISKKMKTNLNILLSKTSSVPFPDCWPPMSRTHSPKSSRVDPGLFGITTRLRPGSPSAEANAPNSPARAHCEGVLLLNKTCGKSKKSRSKHVENIKENGIVMVCSYMCCPNIIFLASLLPNRVIFCHCDTFQTGTTKKWGENNKHKPCFTIAITWLILDILQEREILAAYELQELIH